MQRGLGVSRSDSSMLQRSGSPAEPIGVSAMSVHEGFCE